MKTDDHQSEQTSATRGSRARRVLMQTAAVLGLGAAGGCSNGSDRAAPLAAADPPAVQSTPTQDLQYERFGYYPAWAAKDQGFRVKDLATTGMAGRLTVLAYAFGAIDPTTLTCSAAAVPAHTDGELRRGEGGVDPYADYARPVDAGAAVGGAADPAADNAADNVADHGGPLRGNFNQLKQLKAQFPKLKVVISLGGWAQSKYFSDAAASAESRQKLVASCIDLYIKGNLPPHRGSGGPGAAAGVFDGFDIAWQWPASPGHPGNHTSPADKANHALLLQEFRRQLDALGGEQRYLLTTLLPADPAKIAAGIDIPGVFQAVSFANVQAYDLHGPWESGRTHHLAQLSPSPGDPGPAGARLSAHAAVLAYKAAGVDLKRLTLGLPLYGYGWTGVCTAGQEQGLHETATGIVGSGARRGVAPVKDLLRQFAPEQLENGSPRTDRNYLFHDPVAVASYAWDGSNVWWSFDDARIFEMKASYIQLAGLRGAMLWSLDGDDGTLVRVLDRELNRDPVE
jgi:chitinase